MRCPLECGHCGYRSGPDRREAIDADRLSARIDEAAAEGRLELVIVSGGEPFVAPHALRAVLDASRRHGLKVAVNTAAHWAVSPEAAERVLARFPGITQLDVSADPWHEPFVPIERVRHACAAALARGIAAVVMVRVFDPRADPFLERLADVLGPDLVDRVEVDVGPVSRVGRAEDLTPPGGWPERVPELPEGRCRWANAPVADSDGSVLACCNHEVASRRDALKLGDLARDGLVEIACRADRDPILQALRSLGPAWLARLARELGVGDSLAGAWIPGDVCGLCEDVLGDAERVSALRVALAGPELRAEIALARLLTLGEIDPELAPEPAG